MERIKMVQAGFWRRFGAYCLDCFFVYILLIITSVFISVVGNLLNIQPVGGIVTTATLSNASLDSEFVFLLVLEILIYLVLKFCILRWIYYAIMESSKWQGTLGKKMIGIIVVDTQYNRISFWRATARYWAGFLSFFPVLAGYFMAGFTKDKQALHDKIAKTYVVNRNVVKWGQENPLVISERIWQESYEDFRRARQS